MDDVTSTFATYSIPQMIGIMTTAVVLGLLILVLLFRIVQAMRSVKKYDAACEKATMLEMRMEEMKAQVEMLEKEYEKNIAEAKLAYDQKAFNLQQIIFTRNSEILDLKNKLLEINQLKLYEPHLPE